MVKWSISTINSLRRCNRQYYFGHVAANHGRKNRFRRKAYELKKMQNLNMWKGSVVDKFIELEIIPQIEDLSFNDFDHLAIQAVEMAKKQYEFSLNKRYLDSKLKMANVKNEFAILQIHELGLPYSQNDIDEVYQSISEAITNIPNVIIPQSNINLVDFLKGASWRLPNVMNWSFNVEKVRVSPQIDLLMFYENKPVIIDWKVSNSYVSDYSRQLIVCAITVMNWDKKRKQENGKQPFNMEDFTLLEVNLANGKVKNHELTIERASEMLDYINLTGSDLALLIENKKYETIDIEDFDLTDKDTTCSFCNFKTLCASVLQNKNSYDEKAYLEHVSNY